MNIIEQNLFTIDTVNEAVNLLVPPNISTEESLQYKSRIQRKYSTDKILFGANSFLIQQSSPAYLSFYLYYLTLSGEDVAIVSIDKGKIIITSDMNKGILPKEISKTDLEVLMYAFNTSSWLWLRDIKNIKLKNAFDRWDISHKQIIDKDYYIQLLPSNTTFHLDEMYRVICAYC